jgi:hypothetical protein
MTTFISEGMVTDKLAKTIFCLSQAFFPFFFIFGLWQWGNEGLL